LARQIDDLLQPGTTGAASDQNAIETSPRLQCFAHRMDSRQHRTGPLFVFPLAASGLLLAALHFLPPAARILHFAFRFPPSGS
jgi:hypothetical protein